MITFVLAIMGIALLSTGAMNICLAQPSNSNDTSNTTEQALNLTNKPLANGHNLSNIITPTGDANTYR